ncbi:MAG TPA: thiolase family protein, partial [Acidimicrobiales bacterium]|nr:thiolase family protein [Acidimicrobiales bacterium]
MIVAAVRTPIGKVRGMLADVRPDDLAALSISAVVDRAGVDRSDIEEVILGCANQAGEDNRDVARMAALLSDLPETVAAVTVNRLCASGLHAVNHAAQGLRAGAGSIYVAGGVESMSRAPYSVSKSTSGNLTMFDTSLGWRFPNPALARRFPLEAMGETAENVVEQSIRGDVAGAVITREAQDAFAFQSQVRAAAAMTAGAFDAELVPVPINGRSVTIDEHPRVRAHGNGYTVATDLAKLADLRPAFREGGSVTAGNSAGLNDGASALILTTASYAREHGLEPIARWVSSAAAGVDPRVMGLGPVPATRKALRRAGLE